MKLVGDHHGFTLVEVLVAMCVSGLLLAGLVSATLQSFRVTGHSRTQISALDDIQSVARPIAPDVRMAQQTNVQEEVPAVNQLTLDWSSWLDESGQISQDPVPHHCEYTFLEAEGKVQRDYWRAYQVGNPPTSTTTFGRYISDIKFSRHATPAGNSYVRMVITSSPEGRAATEECLTYQISMRRMEDIPVQ